MSSGPFPIYRQCRHNAFLPQKVQMNWRNYCEVPLSQTTGVMIKLGPLEG